MDGRLHSDDNINPTPGTNWTNEKHVNFLNSMEASFVQTMFENYDINATGGGGSGGSGGGSLRLDRYLPDSSESTLDLRSHRKKTINNITFTSTTTGRGQFNIARTRRSPSSQRHDSSRDQVVPDIERRNGNKDETTYPLPTSIN